MFYRVNPVSHDLLPLPVPPPPYLSLQFSQRFQPYVQYCLRVKQTMAYAREQQDNNPFFRTFVQVGEGCWGRGMGRTLDN